MLLPPEGQTEGTIKPIVEKGAMTVQNGYENF